VTVAKVKKQRKRPPATHKPGQLEFYRERISWRLRKVGFFMKRGLQLSTLLLAVYASSPALADDRRLEPPPPIQLGLGPLARRKIGTLPGGVTPAYGQQSADDKDWRFDFHGFLTMPISRRPQYPRPAP